MVASVGSLSLFLMAELYLFGDGSPDPGWHFSDSVFLVRLDIWNLGKNSLEIPSFASLGARFQVVLGHEG